VFNSRMIKLREKTIVLQQQQQQQQLRTIYCHLQSAVTTIVNTFLSSIMIICFYLELSKSGVAYLKD